MKHILWVLLLCVSLNAAPKKTVSQTISIPCNGGSYAISFPHGFVFQNYSVRLVPNSGKPPYTFSTSNLPNGITRDVNSAYLTLSGLPLKGGTWTVTVVCTGS